MRYPSFIAEMALPENRARLRAGVVSGYGLVAAFTLLLLGANLTGLLPLRPALWAMAGIKLVTNTATWFSLKRERWVLEVSGLNVAADVLVMTGAVYWTGGQLSPLTGIYLIEVTVMALLSNLGITVLVASGAFGAYTLLSVLSWGGVIAQVAPPLGIARPVSVSFLVLDLVWNALLLGAATGFTSTILRRLRARERDLHARSAELVDAERLKSQFMANISHELRTPIHGILGVSDLLAGEVYGPCTEKQGEAIRTAQRSARELLERIEDLLQMSLADAGKLRFRSEELPVRGTVRQAVAACRPMFERKQISIRSVVPDSLGKITTDRAKLNQVLLEMIANAVKFTPEKGSIRLRGFRDPQGWLCLSISDSGRGIPEEEKGRIFDDFRQADGSATRSEGGMGVGLGLVRRLLDLMGGRVQVESSLGYGSTFTIKLPPEPPEPSGEIRIPSGELAAAVRGDEPSGVGGGDGVEEEMAKREGGDGLEGGDG